METKKELWRILSHTECKRVHELVKPRNPGWMRDALLHDRLVRKYETDLAAWEEAERTLNIHPDCLEIKEGDFVYAIHGKFKSHVKFIEDGYLHFANSLAEPKYYTKFPLNSIWHGEEREGCIFLTDKI